MQSASSELARKRDRLMRRRAGGGKASATADDDDLLPSSRVLARTNPHPVPCASLPPAKPNRPAQASHSSHQLASSRPLSPLVDPRASLDHLAPALLKSTQESRTAPVPARHTRPATRPSRPPWSPPPPRPRRHSPSSCLTSTGSSSSRSSTSSRAARSTRTRRSSRPRLTSSARARPTWSRSSRPSSASSRASRTRRRLPATPVRLLPSLCASSSGPRRLAAARPTPRSS